MFIKDKVIGELKKASDWMTAKDLERSLTEINPLSIGATLSKLFKDGFLIRKTAPNGKSWQYTYKIKE